MSPTNREAASLPQAPTSRSLLTWLPFLWTGVLFPSPPEASIPVRRSALLVLVLLPAVLLYPCLSFHLFEPDEGRYAEIPREMLVRGEWVVPYLQGEPYLDKPPLLYWLVMFSYRLLGITDWAARLVPALAVHGTILLVYGLGRRSLGERAAWWGALLLAVAPGFTSVGRLLILDGLLTFWVTLALLAGFEAVRGERWLWSWGMLAALACGFGVLTKGPIILVLVAPPLIAHGWLTRTAQRIGWQQVLAFAGVMAAIALPWYLAVCRAEPEFAGYFFWQHNVQRFLTPFDHLEPVWYYVPILLGGLGPGSFLLIAILRFLLTANREAIRHRTPALGYFLLAGVWCVLFFSLSGSKLPTYILPAFPPLALVLGAYVASRRWQASAWPAAVVGVTVVLLGTLHAVAIPWYAWHRSPIGRAPELFVHGSDRNVPIICYPRHCDSVGFYLRRDDLLNYRSKETPALLRYLQQQPRAVILFTHRHSLESLRNVLPANLRLAQEVPLCGSARPGPEGMCYLAVVERLAPPAP